MSQRYPLVGGPCDGQQSILFTVTPYVGYWVECSRHRYVFGSDGRFHDAGAVTGLGDGTGPLPGQEQVGHAWYAFTRALGVRLPGALNRSAASRKRLRRVVR